MTSSSCSEEWIPHPVDHSLPPRASRALALAEKRILAGPSMAALHDRHRRRSLKELSISAANTRRKHDPLRKPTHGKPAQRQEQSGKKRAVSDIESDRESDGKLPRKRHAVRNHLIIMTYIMTSVASPQLYFMSSHDPT